MMKHTNTKRRRSRVTRRLDAVSVGVWSPNLHSLKLFLCSHCSLISLFHLEDNSNG